MWYVICDKGSWGLWGLRSRTGRLSRIESRGEKLLEFYFFKVILLRDMKIIEKYAKSLYTKTKIPSLDYTVNQYVGCEHGCVYCYAKFINRWKNYGEWGSWVEVKKNAPILAKKYVRGKVSMSTVSDPYQPIEEKLKLTRSVLENMDKDTDLSILTKSDLITRDIDIFRQFKNIEAGFTLNGFSEEMRKILEPGAPPHKNRISALKLLRDNHIRTYCFISPVLPLLTDVKKVISDTEGLVDYYIVEFINVSLAGMKFKNILEKLFPETYRIIRNKKNMLDFIETTKSYLIENNVPVSNLITHRDKRVSP